MRLCMMIMKSSRYQNMAATIPVSSDKTSWREGHLGLLLRPARGKQCTDEQFLAKSPVQNRIAGSRTCKTLKQSNLQPWLQKFCKYVEPTLRSRLGRTHHRIQEAIGRTHPASKKLSGSGSGKIPKRLPLLRMIN